MLKTLKARIIGLGSYLPSKILSNEDLEKIVDTTADWITSRTGIKERRIADHEEFSSTMGAIAAAKAIKAAHISANQIELILVATMTPDYVSPATASLIQATLQIPNSAAVDIQAACTGFLYALSMAKAYVESGIYRHVLVVAVEKMSSVVDYTDRSTCILFGDGASAAVVSASGAGFSISIPSLGSDGNLAHLLFVPAGGCRLSASSESVEKRLHYLKMEGKEVFKHAVRRMVAAAKESMQRANLKESDISWIVPHQANLRIMEAIAKSFDLPMNKVYQTVHKYGNTSASSVAIALDELLQEKEIKVGEHLLLVAFGAGLSWGATILTKIKKEDP